MKNIFDTHSHYDSERFDEDREALLSKMFDEDVAYIMHASTDVNSMSFGIEFSKKYENFYTSVGFHPENEGNIPDNFIELMEVAAKNIKVKAVGEIGLDYHYDGFNREGQIELFKAQLEFAKRHDLPVIIHCREATGDCMEILREYRPKGVMHCFSGSAETAKELIELGMYIGFTGVLTFKNAKRAIEALKVIPKERLLLETDCPYMAPEPNRGKRCDSSMIRFTAEKAAEVLGLSTDEILNLTLENAKKVYEIE